MKDAGARPSSACAGVAAGVFAKENEPKRPQSAMHGVGETAWEGGEQDHEVEVEEEKNVSIDGWVGSAGKGQLKPVKVKKGKKKKKKISSAKGAQTKPWMKAKYQAVRPGLSAETKSQLHFSPSSVAAQSELALREKPILVPVTRSVGKSKRSGGETADGDCGAPNEEETKEEEEGESDKPRFSAISLNNSRRAFRNKLREEMSSSIIRMSKIHSQQVFETDRKEKTLEKLCAEMRDLLVLAGDEKTSPIIGVDGALCERHADLKIQMKSISAKIKAVQQDTKQLRKTLTKNQDEHIIVRADLNKKEASVKRVISEKEDLIKLKAQLDDLVKRTRAKFTAAMHAYQYQKESQDHALYEKKIEHNLVKEKTAMEAKLQAGQDQWEAELQENGVEVMGSPKLQCKSKELADEVFEIIEKDLDADPRIQKQADEQRRAAELARIPVISSGGLSGGKQAPASFLPRATRKHLKSLFKSILHHAKAASGFQSCLNNPEFMGLVFKYSLEAGYEGDDIDVILGNAPDFIKILQDGENYRNVLQDRLDNLMKARESTKSRRHHSIVSLQHLNLPKLLDKKEIQQKLEATHDRLMKIAKDEIYPYISQDIAPSSAQLLDKFSTPQLVKFVEQSFQDAKARYERRLKNTSSIFVREIIDTTIGEAVSKSATTAAAAAAAGAAISTAAADTSEPKRKGSKLWRAGTLDQLLDSVSESIDSAVERFDIESTRED